MPNRIPIQSLSQPELDVYARLTDHQLRNRLEPEKGIFIAQTPKVIALALENGYEPLSILAEDGQLGGEAARLLEAVGRIPIYTAPRELLAELTGYALTRGILCAMRRPKMPRLEEICAGASRIAVLDGVVDATNVGAVIRSAAALNMDGVVVTSTCCDPLNRRAVRVSMGTVFQIPWTRIEAETWAPELRNLGFRTAAMALRKDSMDIDDPILTKEEKLAVVLGSEGWGLPQQTIDQCDYTVCIPMGHGVDSLNVAAASAVAFWQLGRSAKKQFEKP